MRLIARSLVFFFFFLFFAFSFVPSALAATTSFRSASIISTDTLGTFYTNLSNCSVTDGNTCDRVLDASYGNLYFRDFGDFAIPSGSSITSLLLRVTGKATAALYAGVSEGTSSTTFNNCQTPSDLWTMGSLNSSTIATYSAATVLSSGLASCLSLSNITSNNFIFRINYSSGQSWSSNIDNFEIAFDYTAPTPTPTPTPTKIPLILIPGIGGSEFKSNQTFTSNIKDCGTLPAFTYGVNDVVWFNTIIIGLSPCDDYLDVLKLKEDGQTPIFSQIILTGDFFQAAYGDLIKFFTDNGYELNKTLFLFPYDWRKDISTTKSSLDDKINQIKSQTGSQKVDIIAHSMGGLVARNYILDAGKALNVRKLFTLGIPHLGSVDFLKNLEFGGCLTSPKFKKSPYCIGVASSEVKDVLQNMISGYELAPSQEYFNFYNGQDKEHLYPYKNNDQVLSYDQIKSLLTNKNHNTSLFIPAEAFHNLDKSLSSTNGVDIINIAGSGRPTLGQIREKGVKKDGFTINGDETVPLFSASLIDSGRNKSLLGNAKVYYTNQEHGNLVVSGSALNLVKNILNNNSQLPAGVSAAPYSFSGTEVSVHSPVNIHVYDSLGNHTGLTSNGDFEANIPGSSYYTLDDAKFIWLPDNGQYDIKLEATDKGSFDFKIRKFENDVNTSVILYNDVPLSTSSEKIQIALNTLSAQSPTLQIDQDGNGTIDSSIDSTAVLTGDAVYDEAITTPIPTATPTPTPTSTPIPTSILTPAVIAKSNETLTKNDNDNISNQLADIAGVRDVDISNGEREKQDMLAILILSITIIPQLLSQTAFLMFLKKFW